MGDQAVGVDMSICAACMLRQFQVRSLSSSSLLIVAVGYLVSTTSTSCTRGLGFKTLVPKPAILSRFSWVSPDKFRDSSFCYKTGSFHIIFKLLFTDLPIIRRYRVNYGEWNHNKENQVIIQIEWLTCYLHASVGKAGHYSIIYIVTWRNSLTKEVVRCWASDGKHAPSSRNTKSVARQQLLLTRYSTIEMFAAVFSMRFVWSLYNEDQRGNHVWDDVGYIC
jgi:hypothetical protein